MPAPADVFVYTQAEWDALPEQNRHYDTVQAETVWVWPDEPRPA